MLRCIQCTDKDHIPGELKYRDRGHMYFPSKDFLTVLRGIDSCVMENANESTLRKYGPDMIDVAVKQVEATQKFQCQFKSLVTNCLLEKDGTVDVLTFDLAIKVVYKELCRKLCHTRLGEYISATQQNLAALKGKSTLAGSIFLCQGTYYSRHENQNLGVLLLHLPPSMNSNIFELYKNKTKKFTC